MAQQDTGLGWSAKSEWLIQNANAVLGSISTFGGPSYPGQPIPKNITAPGEIITGGMVMIDYDSSIPGDPDTYTLYCAAEGNYDVLAFSTPDGSNTRYGFITKTQNARVNVLKLNNNSGLYTVNPFTVSYAYRGFYIATTSTSLTNPTVHLPVFSSLDDAINHVAVSSSDITKTSDGYAVACLAKWKTDNGVLFTTPVLISSKTENTDMTCSDPSYNLAKLNIRYDGVQFYMSFFDIVDSNITSWLELADLSEFKIDLDQLFRLIAQSGMSNIQVTETVDPFNDFPYNGEDAGEINPDPQDDDVDFDDLPTKSFSTGGFCRIFNPDVSDLNDLASYMWTDQTFLQTVINHLKQILENPIEAIISLSLVPVSPPSSPTKVPVNVMFFNTGVTMRPVTSQFVTVDCGTTVLQESFGGALDYNPYTRVQMYLPYIGTVQLDTDEVMSKTLHLKYFIDIVTGICCAELKADDKLLYHFSGHCSVSQPITSADFSSYLNAAIAAAKLAVGVATGMAASTAAATAAQTPPAPSTPSSGAASTALVPVPTNQALVPSSGLAPRIQDPPEYDNSKLTALWGELSKPGNLNTAAAAMGGKMVVQHSGGFSGNSGYLAKRRPYLIVTRPRIANPEEYGQHNGRPSMMYLNLGSCTGYTQVQSVHLTGFDATNPELSEISTLLKGGVIL